MKNDDIWENNKQKIEALYKSRKAEPKKKSQPYTMLWHLIRYLDMNIQLIKKIINQQFNRMNISIASFIVKQECLEEIHRMEEVHCQ